MHIYRRKDSPTWWCWYYDARGRRQRVSTQCTDKRAAERAAARFERETADPTHRPANETTLGRAIERLITDRVTRGRAGGTVNMYTVKGRQLVRVLGDVSLEDIDAREVDRFIAVRLKEGAARNTIAKELGTLRAALKIAKRRLEYAADLEAVMPIGFSPDYRPREGYVKDADALHLLLDELRPDRRGVVCFIIATGARISEALRARRSDVDLERGTVRMRGTKTAGAAAVIPIVSFTRPLIEYAVASMPFAPWGNYGHDLPNAAKRAGLERLTANDLRRTCATWLRQGGAAPHLIAGVLRHRDTRMVERVYGRMPAESLGPALEAELRPRAAVTVGRELN